MANINLLPEEFRASDERHSNKIRSKKTVDLSLTDPAKNKKNKSGVWHSLFGGFKKIEVITKHAESEPVPAEAIKGHLKIPKTDVSKLFHKINKTPSIPTPKPVPQVEAESVKTIPTNTAPQAPITAVKPAKEEPVINKKTVKPSIDNSKKDGLTPQPLKPRMVMHTPAAEPRSVMENGSGKGLMAKLKEFFASLFGKTASKHKMVEVDLMPEKLVTLKEIDWTRVFRMSVISIGLGVGVIIVGYLILLDRGQKQESDFRALQQKIADLNVDIKGLLEEQDSALLLQKQLQTADYLIKGHVYWSNLLDFLEQNTLDGVYYQGLQAGEENTEIKLDGVAVNLETAYWQRELLEKQTDFINRVTLTSFEYDPLNDNTIFSFALKLKPGALKK